MTGHYQDEVEMINHFHKHSLPIPRTFSIIIFEFPNDITIEMTEVYQYEELGIFQLLEELSHNKNYPTHPSIRKLKAYDIKNQTELLRTLTVYFEKDKNPNEASQQLHIHVNTLNYRLKRISEIGQVRLKDLIQKMSIFLDIKLIQYQQMIIKDHL